MKYIYCLKIDLLNKVSKNHLSDILGISPTKEDEQVWELEVIENENDSNIDFINYFLDILYDKYDKLRNIGVGRKNITIWMYYEYDEQCNMEFLPSQMKRLGDNNISLCISCWES